MPIERALNGVPAVIARRSRTIFGLSVVRVDVRLRHRRLLRARRWCSKNCATPRCRTASRRRSGRWPRPSASCIATWWRARATAIIELRELEDWVIEPRFRQVPGIADVTPFGGLVKQYQVEIDPQRARQVQPVDRADRAGGERQQPERGRRAARQQPAVDGDPRRRAGPERRRHREHRGDRDQGRAGVRPRHRAR